MALRQSRERPEKILVAMHKLADGQCALLKYEDIVVKAFEMFPDEFALRGHPQYPDSSDIHKPLYGPLKRKGLVRAASKMFALTPRGAEVALRLIATAGEALDRSRSPVRLTRDREAEVERLLKSEAFRFFVEGKKERILDTDFYAFFGCTVRTGKNDFLGRLSTVRDAVDMATKLSKPNVETARKLAALMSYLVERFKPEIEAKETHG
jgi:hypothetical protein